MLFKIINDRLITPHQRNLPLKPLCWKDFNMVSMRKFLFSDSGFHERLLVEMSMCLHSSKDQQRKVIRGRQSFHLLSEALVCTQCNVELTILNMNLLCVSLQIQKSQSRNKRWFCDFIFSALDCKVEARWIRVVSNSATIVGKTRKRSIIVQAGRANFCFYACKTCFKRLC